MTDETYIDFTSEELLVLCELLALDPPPGLGVASLTDLALAGNEDALRDAATRSLHARGVLDGDTVVEAVHEVLKTATDPGVIASVSAEADGIVETRFLAAMPEIAVEHQGLSVSLHRFIPFATRDLLPRILGFVDLRPFDPEATVSFTIAEETLDAVSDALDRHDHEAAHQRLITDGVDEATARTFAIALTMRHASASVTILHRPSEDQVEGGALTWIDAGLSGLWVTEVTVDEDSGDEDSGQLEVRLVSAKTVAAELLTYLPEAFSEYGVAL